MKQLTKIKFKKDLLQYKGYDMRSDWACECIQNKLLKLINLI